MMLRSVSSLWPPRPPLYHAAAALFFLIVAAVFYLPYLSELPGGIHVWAQCDRLSLAINYYDYGFHFLTPRTYSLTSIGGVTGVEFPIQAYLAALGGAVFGRNSILTIFRLLDVTMMVVGFYFLFRLIYERTGHFVAGLVPGAFLLASPTFAYYAGSFMPDPFSLSLSFIGYYFWLRFFREQRFADLRLSVLLLAVAGLIKTTTALHFGAVVGITLVWAFLQPELLRPRERRQLLAVASIGFGLIIFFFLHNQALNDTYQSGIFRAAPNLMEGPDTAHEVLYNLRTLWLAEYATVTHYRMIAACLALFLVFLLPNVRRNLPITLLLLAAVAVSFIFIPLMGAGLAGHDYHMICAMIPPAMLLLVLGLLNLGKYAGKIRYGTSFGLALLILFLLTSGYRRLNRRMSDEYPPFTPYAHLWMRGGAAEMKQAGVPQAATMLVFNDSSPNLSLVYFDRRGRVWQPQTVAAVTVEDFLSRMAADNLDYLLMAPTVYAQLVPAQQAALSTEFETVGKEPGMIFRRRNRNYPW